MYFAAPSHPRPSSASEPREAVPDARDGEDVARLRRIGLDLAAQVAHVDVDHPGLDTPELRAINHIGYDNVAADRQGVTDVWTDPRVKKAIEAKGVQLISYKDLRKK